MPPATPGTIQDARMTTRTTGRLQAPLDATVQGQRDEQAKYQLQQTLAATKMKVTQRMRGRSGFPRDRS